MTSISSYNLISSVKTKGNYLVFKGMPGISGMGPRSVAIQIRKGGKVVDLSQMRLSPESPRIHAIYLAVLRAIDSQQTSLLCSWKGRDRRCTALKEAKTWDVSAKTILPDDQVIIHQERTAQKTNLTVLDAMEEVKRILFPNGELFKFVSPKPTPLPTDQSRQNSLPSADSNTTVEIEEPPSTPQRSRSNSQMSVDSDASDYETPSEYSSPRVSRSNSFVQPLSSSKEYDFEALSEELHNKGPALFGILHYNHLSMYKQKYPAQDVKRATTAFETLVRTPHSTESDAVEMRDWLLELARMAKTYSQKHFCQKDYAVHCGGKQPAPSVENYHQFLAIDSVINGLALALDQVTIPLCKYLEPQI